MPKPVLFGLRGLQNEENGVAASRHLTPICRGKWRSLGEDIGTTDLLAHNQDVVGPFLSCKLLALKEVVGANGFEPSTSWSRTSLDQTKSVELTAFVCAFPPLIWATWATKMPSGLRSRISEPRCRELAPLGPCQDFCPKSVPDNPARSQLLVDRRRVGLLGLSSILFL